MTDNERMDRAKRIREMREGARDDGEETPSEKTEKPQSDETEKKPSNENESDRTDESGPQKQTMEDIVESSRQESTATTATDDTGQTNTVDNENSMTDDTADHNGDTKSAATDNTATTGAEQTAAADNDTEQTDDDGITAPLPEMDELEEALEGSEGTVDPETVSPGAADTAGQGGAVPAAVEGESAPEGGQAVATPEAVDETETTTEEETRVLEFTLDDEHYCLDIQYIEEIVKHENITRVPNTPAHVEGVVDLRGQITTILNPKITIGKENAEAGDLIVVFDAEAFEDQGYIGWVVDDVRQVSPIVESEVNDPPMAEEYINGVIDREDDDEFVIWTSPHLAFEDS